jgi:fumarate reductase subunit D
MSILLSFLKVLHVDSPDHSKRLVSFLFSKVCCLLLLLLLLLLALFFASQRDEERAEAQ